MKTNSSDTVTKLDEGTYSDDQKTHTLRYERTGHEHTVARDGNQKLSARDNAQPASMGPYVMHLANCIEDAIRITKLKVA